MRVFSVEIVGHLTTQTFNDELTRVSLGLRGSEDRVAVLFDILRMTGYDPPVRSAYIDWHGKHRDRLARVAVVTDKSLWRMVVSTIGMAVRASVRAFEEVSPAHRWCESEDARR